MRPDSLINEEEISPYTTHLSPIHTLFKPGKTSRINVANFISELASNNEIWSVPLDPANRHYQAIQEWVKEGNKIAEAD